jgi:hypothetical protein
MVVDALADAFDRSSLGEVFGSLERDFDLYDKAAPGPLRQVVFELVRVAEQEGWIAELIEAAYRARPQNAGIREIYERTRPAPLIGVSEQPPSSSQLERVIRQNAPFLDLGVWQERLARIEPRICRVEIEGVAHGTGFLVGPDVVLTTYHILERVIKGQIEFSTVDLRFDMRRLGDGTILPGMVFKLASEWLIDYSPYSPAEPNSPDAAPPQPDELDYALIRVLHARGLHVVQRQPGGDLHERGWIEVPRRDFTFSNGQPLLILQYPEGQSLKLAIDMESVLGINENGTRVRYKTNTTAGASGAPCLDVNLELVAMHHLGDPGNRPKRFNQGIPISAIRRLLEARGKADSVGGTSP